MSAYFILVANSWMQHPVGSTVSGGEARLTNVWDLITNRFALYAFTHTMLVALTTGSLVVLGVACWHLVRGRNADVFRRAAALALIVAVPITTLNMLVGSRFGLATTDYQPMKIAAAEALWDTQQPASFSLFQIPPRSRCSRSCWPASRCAPRGPATSTWPTVPMCPLLCPPGP